MNIQLDLAQPKVKFIFLDTNKRPAYFLEGRDIGPTSGTLTFPPGSTVECISVSILDDSVVEAEEQFILQLGAAGDQAVTIVGGTVEVTICDDDGTYTS